jgi:hypothetical protein
MNKLFPTILIVLDLLSSFVYLLGCDYKKALYWVSAAILTICVTY